MTGDLGRALRCGDGRAGIGLCLMGELDTIASTARAAEDAGVASVWVGEYFQSPFVRLALIASSTRRVVIGTHVAQAFARSPLAAALAASELQTLSQGRMVLGLGGQVPAVNRKWLGVDPPPRLADVAEQVEAVRAILAGGGATPVRIRGERLSLDIPAFAPLGQVEPPPVALGAAGPASIALAATVGDAVLGHLFATPDGLMSAVTVAAPAGRAPVPTTMARIVAPASVDGWASDAAHQLAWYAITPSYQQYLVAAGVGIEREALLDALKRSDGARVAELAAPLVERFCVHDDTTLRATMDAASRAGLAGVVFFAPYTLGSRVPASRYERAAVEMFAASGVAA